MLTVVLSLSAAVCFGVASVLQHHGANRVPRRFPLHPGLLADVAQQPWWLLGVVAEVVGVALHMTAVNVGELSVVQPLLTLGLVVALPLQALLGRRVRRRSLLAAALVVAGLAVFLSVRPYAQSRVPQTLREWAPGLALAAAVGAVMLVIALLGRGRVRSLGLGAAAGTFLATSAALVKTWGSLLDAGGILALAPSWQLWTALGCGLVGALLSLAAFQSGPLGPPLAAMMVVDPILGVSLGTVLYGEPFSTGPLAAVQAAGFALALSGVWLLATGERSVTPEQGRSSAAEQGASDLPGEARTPERTYRGS